MSLQKNDMNYSYWEHKEWFSDVDYTIVGSGIVGLSCALALKRKHPKAKVLVLERGMLPQGASTKNAGFACFGSLSEMVDDLETHSEEEVYQLVEKRWLGLQLLRETLGDAAIDYQENKGYELFLDPTFFDSCLAHQNRINRLLKPIFKAPVFDTCTNVFGFQNTLPQYSVNRFEGQIDTGKMMTALLQKVQREGICVLNNCQVKALDDLGHAVHIETTHVSFDAKRVLIATNGFARHLLDVPVQPARAQVLITKPIPNLHIKGTFHLDKGYYYFRNIDNRILFGGGRNLDFKGEETTEMTQTPLIQNQLECLLRETILPKTAFEIDHRWSGIMGVGLQKKSIVKSISKNVFCGVRMGGMGVAIGSLVGKELASLVHQS